MFFSPLVRVKRAPLPIDIDKRGEEEQECRAVRE